MFISNLPVVNFHKYLTKSPMDFNQTTKSFVSGEFLFIFLSSDLQREVIYTPLNIVKQKKNLSLNI